MEGRKQSSSSFTSELFGSSDSHGGSSSSSSSGFFGSIFPPPSKVMGREGPVEKKQDPAQHVWRAPDDKSSEGENQSNKNREMGSYYQEQKPQPCPLSSSIYYGGQDIYAQPQDTQTSAYTTFNKDEGEDDSGSASRGNWWQGSLYY